MEALETYKNTLLEINKKIEKLYAKEKYILKMFTGPLNQKEYVEKAVAEFAHWYSESSYVSIRVQLECAWSDTITLEIYKDTHKLKMSSGGIDDDSKYLEQLHNVTGDLLELVKEENQCLIEALESIKKSIDDLSMEQMRVKTEIRRLEGLEDKKEVNIEDLFKKANEGKEVEFYYFANGYYYKAHLAKRQGKYMIDRTVWGKKEIKEYFGKVYIKK
jgi:predicted S18 family serine protease